MLWLVHSSFLVAFVLIPKVHIRSSRVLSENRLFEISFSHWHDNQMGAMDKPQVILPFIYIYTHKYYDIIYTCLIPSHDVVICHPFSPYLLQNLKVGAEVLPARAWRRRPFRGQMILPLGVAAFRAKRSPAPNFMGYVVSYFFCSFIPKVQHLVDSNHRYVHVAQI